MDEEIQLLKDIRDLLTRIEAKLTPITFVPLEPFQPTINPPWRVDLDGTGNPPPHPTTVIY